MKISICQKSRACKLWLVFALVLLAALIVNQPTIKALVTDDLPAKTQVDASQPDLQVDSELLSDAASKVVWIAFHH